MTRSQAPIWDDIARVPVQDIQPHPENPREGDVDMIATMIQENGWHGVLVVQRSTGNILVGNHRYRAGKQIGMDTFPVHYVDVDDAQALRILLADNRASDVATYDDERLLRLVLQVGDADSAVAVLADPQATSEERAQALALLKDSPYGGTGYRGEDVTQLGMDLFPQPNDTVYRTPEDMAERYEQTAVRQIILIMGEDEYGVMVPALKLARQRYGVETNTDAIMELLRKDGYLQAVADMQADTGTVRPDDAEEPEQG